MSPELQLPRLKRTLRVLERPGLLQVRSADESFAIEDAPDWLHSFLLALDGEADLPSVGERLRRSGARVRLADLDVALEQLHKHGLVEDASDDRLLSSQQLERYDRQLRYFSEPSVVCEGAVQAQLRLLNAHVVVLGLGALGGNVVQALAAAGVGEISGVDGDTVELSNLNRQTVYCEADLGRPKALAIAERIRALNSEVVFNGHQTWLHSQRDVEARIAGADLVIDAADSPPYEIERWVNDACFELRIPYIGMSHYPPSIRVGPTYIPGETGCYRCQEASWREDDPLFDVVPTEWKPAAIGPTAAAVGAMVAMEAITYLAGLGSPHTVGKAIILNLSTCEIDERPVVRRPGCPTCDRRSSAA